MNERRRAKAKLLCTICRTMILAFPLTSAFLGKHTIRSRPCKFQLNWIPLTDIPEVTFFSYPPSYRLSIGEKGEFLNENGCTEFPNFILSIAEEDDLPTIAALTVEVFGADAISLSRELSPMERTFLQPGVSMWNAYTGAVAYTEVLSGLRQRMQHRFKENEMIHAPDIVNVSSPEAEAIAAKSSIILALARPCASPLEDDTYAIEAIATVELRLQPTDGKIPFSQPWFDNLERGLAKLLGIPVSPKDSTLQPYLSNLCVYEKARGRNIGKALVRCVESIAKDSWGYSKMYLHVDFDNKPALALYTKEKYHDVGLRWNPFWSGSASKIGYFVKYLQ